MATRLTHLDLVSVELRPCLANLSAALGQSVKALRRVARVVKVGNVFLNKNNSANGAIRV